MDIKRSFEILEISCNSTEDEVKQSYKDIVAVWHPDRHYNNPRLRQKAEKKLKEVNAAYETLDRFFSSNRLSEQARQKKEYSRKKGPYSETAGSKKSAETKTKTEIAAQIGTEAFLCVWSYMSNRLQHILAEQDSEAQTNRGNRPE